MFRFPHTLRSAQESSHRPICEVKSAQGLEGVGGGSVSPDPAPSGCRVPGQLRGLVWQRL